MVVVDSDRRLIGTVTDGDIRRGILRGKSLEDSIEEVMFRSPDWAPVGTDREVMLGILTAAEKRQLPILDAEHRVGALDVHLVVVGRGQPSPHRHLRDQERDEQADGDGEEAGSHARTVAGGRINSSSARSGAGRS